MGAVTRRTRVGWSPAAGRRLGPHRGDQQRHRAEDRIAVALPRAAAVDQMPQRTTDEPCRRLRTRNAAAASRITPASSRLTTASGMTPERPRPPAASSPRRPRPRHRGHEEPTDRGGADRLRRNSSLSTTPQRSGVASSTDQTRSGMNACVHPEPPSQVPGLRPWNFSGPARIRPPRSGLLTCRHSSAAHPRRQS
jgi:hypothetical protein